MAGLLSQPNPTGLLGNNALLRDALAQAQAAITAPVPTQAAPAPQRSLLAKTGNFLDDMLFGGRATALRDERRQRDMARAMQPEMMRRQTELRRIAEGMGPAARIAFETNPEKFGESLAEQYAPQVIAAGGVQSIAGTGQRVGAPQRFEFGDTVQSFDPVSGRLSQLAERGPTIAEQTAKDKLEWDRQYGQGRLGIDQQNADTAAASAGVTLSPGQVRYDTSGRQVAVNANPTPAQQSSASEIDAQLGALSTDVEPVLKDMRSLLESGDIITGIGAEARLQAARAAAALGDDKARREVAATERYRNLSGRLRVGMAKSLGPNPSNADIQLLERVTAGDIGQSREGLLATLRDGEQLAARQRQALSSRRPSGQPRSGGPVAVNSQAEYNALPSGTLFIAPDGSTRRKP